MYDRVEPTIIPRSIQHWNEVFIEKACKYVRISDNGAIIFKYEHTIDTEINIRVSIYIQEQGYEIRYCLHDVKYSADPLFLKRNVLLTELLPVAIHAHLVTYIIDIYKNRGQQ